MIVKVKEFSKNNTNNSNIFLFYGLNEGLKNEILNRLYENYSKSIPLIGKYVVGKSEPYEYLINSIKKFYSQDEFVKMIKKHNFTNVSYRSLSGGIVAIHSAWKV